VSQTIGNCDEHQNNFWRFGNTSNTIFLHMYLAEFVISYKAINLAQNAHVMPNPDNKATTYATTLEFSLRIPLSTCY